MFALSLQTGHFRNRFTTFIAYFPMTKTHGSVGSTSPQSPTTVLGTSRTRSPLPSEISSLPQLLSPTGQRTPSPLPFSPVGILPLWIRGLRAEGSPRAFEDNKFIFDRTTGYWNRSVVYPGFSFQSQTRTQMYGRVCIPTSVWPFYSNMRSRNPTLDF